MYMEIARKYAFRDEELPVIGKFVVSNYRDDMSDFEGFSDKFNPSHADTLMAEIENVESLLGHSVTAELKSATQKLYVAEASLRPQLDRMEGYVKLAVDELTISVKDFGISAVRKSLNKGNTEGILKGLLVVLHNIIDNEAALSAQGMKAATHDTLQESYNSINGLNLRQNELIRKRAVTIGNNIIVFNALWAHLSGILRVGQSLYRNTDPVRKKEYTTTVLKRRIHAERKPKNNG
jgi:hypothetical protein